MEAEKSTFQGELSFQRSECTAGLTVATTFLLLLKTILCKQPNITLNLAKLIYICILYLKYLETYLETLHSHFQPSCHFKMFKNSGSGQSTPDCTQQHSANSKGRSQKKKSNGLCRKWIRNLRLRIKFSDFVHTLIGTLSFGSGFLCGFYTLCGNITFVW
jgi:hypothetical protein